MVIPARIELASQVPQTCILPLNYGIIISSEILKRLIVLSILEISRDFVKLVLMKASLEKLQTEINKIKVRNKRVEKDKEWETSWFRKILIMILTYIVVVVFFFFAKLPKPFINAIVPAMAFILSTLSISFFKKWWMEKKYRKSREILHFHIKNLPNFLKFVFFA